MNALQLNIDKQLGQPNAHGKMERRVIANLLDRIQKGGFQIVGIDDYEEFTKATTIKDAMELIFNLDEAAIIIQPKGRTTRHYVKIVLGNSEACDIIADWSYNTDDRRRV